MGKGLFIMLIVFGVVALLHFTTLKIRVFPEEKKRKFRKVFWYFYGVLFISQGIVRMIEKERLIIISIIMCIVGITSIVLNYFDKINPKPKDL